MSSDSSADIHKDLDIETIKERLVAVPEDDRDIGNVNQEKYFFVFCEPVSEHGCTLES